MLTNQSTDTVGWDEVYLYAITNSGEGVVRISTAGLGTLASPYVITHTEVPGTHPLVAGGDSTIITSGYRLSRDQSTGYWGLYTYRVVVRVNTIEDIPPPTAEVLIGPGVDYMQMSDVPVRFTVDSTTSASLWFTRCANSNAGVEVPRPICRPALPPATDESRKPAPSSKTCDKSTSVVPVVARGNPVFPTFPPGTGKGLPWVGRR